MKGDFMKKAIHLLIFCLIFAGAVSLLLPLFRQRAAREKESRAVEYYREAVAEKDSSEIEDMLNRARAFNDEIAVSSTLVSLTPAEEAAYTSLLDVSGTGIMGYVDVPGQNIHLPIYHGTGADVLAKGAGHLESSSLPVGGTGSHSVITGHTGLDGSILFDNLSKMKVGDTFTVTVLDEAATYTVDRIDTVSPADTSLLARDPARDLSTLVTCIPYGVNDKRLCVQGSRTGTARVTPAPVHGVNPVRTGDTWAATVVFVLTILSGLLALFMLRHYMRTKI